MKELELKYGCNPNQKPAKIAVNDGRDLPIEVLCGRPGYINFMDAFNGWQLVSELKKSNRTSGGDFFQARIPGRGSSGTPSERYTCKNLLGG